MKDWQKALVSVHASILEAIATLDQVSTQIALIVDESGTLSGTITDGDVRRAILRGVDFSQPVSRIMATKPIVASTEATVDEILRFMKVNNIRHIPIVDDQGKVQGLSSISDIVLKTLPNKAVIMAGGLGSRLAPLTDNCPKPMLHIGKQPILETIVRNLVHAHFDKLYISINYYGEMIKQYFGDGSKWGVSIEYLEETKRLGTAGALSLIPQIPAEPFLVINGDVITKVDFQSLLDFHISQGADLTACVRDYDFRIPYGVVELDGPNVMRLVEKPVQRFFVNAGIYVLASETLARIPKDTLYDMPELLEALLRDGKKVLSFPLREYWIDVGHHDDFEKASQEFEEQFSN